MVDDRLSVLMVMDSLSVGGTETHVLSLMKGLQKLGLMTVYAGAGGSMYEAYARAGCPFYPVDLTPGTLMREAAGEEAAVRLKHIMRARRIGVVHVHQTPSGVYAAKSAAELGIPVAFTVHGAYYSAEQLRLMASLSQAVIAVSEPVQAYLKHHGVASELVPNGVDPAEFYPVKSVRLRRSLGIPDEARVIVYASRLAWDKAAVCSLLLLAVHRLHSEGMSDLHAVVVGDGNQFDEIKELAETLEGNPAEPQFHVVGSRTKLREYFGLADLVVGTGRVALEAMACGKPVLAVGNHGFFGMVEPSSYGQAWANYFGDHASVGKPTREMLADSLREALSDPDRLRTVGILGREWTLKEFDYRDVSVKIEKIYRRIRQRLGGDGDDGS